MKTRQGTTMPTDTPSQNPPEITQTKIQTETKGNTLRNIAIILLVLISFGIGSVAVVNILSTDTETSNNNTAQDEEPIVIGLSLATLRTERWQRDRDFIIEEAKKYNAVVNVVNANDDPALQKSQVENLVFQGVDVLIIVPIDTEQAAEMITIANENNIKVIAYDRLIQNSNLDYYISFDSVKVGEIQAQGVLDVTNEGTFAYIGGAETDNNAYLLKEGSFGLLQSAIDQNKVEVAIDTFTPDWKEEEAYKTIKNYLNADKQLDAVIAANDGTASGVIAALEEFELSGLIPVSGQDAELSACQRVVEGTQTVTVYKPLDELAKRAVMTAISIVNNQSAETNTTINNGSVDVPSYLLTPIKVTADNMIETIITSGFHSYEDVYKNIPEELRPEYTN